MGNYFCSSPESIETNNKDDELMQIKSMKNSYKLTPPKYNNSAKKVVIRRKIRHETIISRKRPLFIIPE